MPAYVCMRHPTSHDVARAAGVSQPTVSRALRADPAVSEATRERVRRAAVELAYVPSSRGRSLSTRTTRQVAMVVSDLRNPFYAEAAQALQAAFALTERRVVVVTDSPERPVGAEALLDGSIDGAVLATCLLDSRLPAALAGRGLPVVLFNRAVDDAPVDTCVSANREGGRQIAAELVRLGHRRIGALLGPAETSTAREREAGFRAGLADAGVDLPAERVQRGPYSYEAGHQGLRALLAVGAPPTAVFCGNDVIALGALNAASAAGTDVPTRLSLIGFDDITMASWDAFQLTTVRQDLAAMAGETAKLLLERIADPDRPPRHVTVPVTLTRRASHAPVSSTDR